MSRIQRVREWEDGFEDLQSIPYSFALELKDLRDAWSMFSDSNEDKVREEERLGSIYPSLTFSAQENLLALLTSRLVTR